MQAKYVIAWIVWLVAFGVIESIALRNGEPGDTLSELVWSIIGKHPVIWWIFGGFMSWLVIHFLSRGRWA